VRGGREGPPEMNESSPVGDWRPPSARKSQPQPNMSSSLPTPSRPSRQPEGRAKREKSRPNSLGDGILWLGLMPILILVPWWTIKAHYRG
jgi:hypothetical protein